MACYKGIDTNLVKAIFNTFYFSFPGIDLCSLIDVFIACK